MNRILLAAMAAVLCAGVASAFDACNPCPPKPCVTYKWINVTETIECEVPVTTWVEEPCEVQVTKMVPTQVECERMVKQTIYEEKTVPVMRTVYECKEYTVNVKKKEYRMETRTREVKRTVYDCVEEEVCKIVYDEVCDPCTGKITKVAREEMVMVPKKVKRVVCEQEEYQVKVPYYVDCPVVKTRQVKKCVEDSKVVKVAKCITVPEKYMKTVLKPVTETKTVMKKVKVSTTKKIEKQVTRKVKVPVEAEPICPPAPAC